MKLKFSSIITFCLYSIILMDGQFFACIPVLNEFLKSTGLNSYYNRTLIGFLSICLFIWIISNHRFYGFQLTKSALSTSGQIIAFWLLSVIIVTAYSLIAYNQELRYIFPDVRHYSLLLCVYPFLFYLFYYNSIEKLMKVVTICTLANVVVIMLSVISYSISHVYLFDIYTFGIRSGALYSRCTLGSLFPIVIIYSIYKIFNDRNKKYILPLVFYLFVFVYIDQTRARMAFYAITVIVMVFFSGTLSIRKMANSIILTIISLVIIYSGLMSTFIDSFSLNAENGISTYNRIGEVGYYWQVFTNNPLFGYGFISDHYSNLISIKSGSNLTYHPGDVGVLGLLAEGGILLAVPYLCFLVRMFYVYKTIKHDTKYQMFFLGILTYCIVSSLTQSLNRQILFLLIPVSWAMFEFEYYNCKTNKIEALDKNEKQGLYRNMVP